VGIRDPEPQLANKMKNNFLVKGLVIPLSMAAAASMLMASCTTDPWRSLLVNLAATFVGSIVTVFYVEVILRRDEQRQWKLVTGHVAKQVSTLGNAGISSIRLALGLSLPEAFEDFEAVKDPATLRKLMTELAENLKSGIAGLADIDQAGWRTLAGNLRALIVNCERLLALFGRNLDPVLTGLLLDVGEKARQLLAHYEIIPDLLGVPLDQLKPNRIGKSSVPFVRATQQAAVRDATQLLEICVKLLREVGSRLPEKKA
jgi:membrane protein YqaA with SNARE-associated domain